MAAGRPARRTPRWCWRWRSRSTSCSTTSATGSSGILAGLATVYLTIGGARYTMAGGDPGEVERAREALRSAARGYALAALAPLVVEILKGLVGA